MFVIIYEDDDECAYNDGTELNILINSLIAKGSKLTHDGQSSYYGGMTSGEDSSGRVSMTQQGLTNKIIQSMTLEDYNPNRTL